MRWFWKRKWVGRSWRDGKEMLRIDLGDCASTMKRTILYSQEVLDRHQTVSRCCVTSTDFVLNT